MSAADAMFAGRVIAEAQMVDTCRIQRETSKTLDPVTDRYVAEYADLYEGPCKVGERDVQENRNQAGGRLVYEQARVVSIPVTGGDVRPGDVVTCLTSLLDPSLPGVRMLIRSIPRKSFLTARRLVVEEMTA